jgi:agmatinase
MTPFDPDAAALPGSGIFGLPEDKGSAAVHVIAAPFDATSSYGDGAADAPAAIFRASHQVELHDPVAGDPWREGLAYLEDDGSIAGLNEEAHPLAKEILTAGGAAKTPELQRSLARVNELCERMNDEVYRRTTAAFSGDHSPIILGGDHSVAFGAVRAAAERYPGLGILHFDAHADLRPSYEGFTCSHASIFHNLITKLDSLGPILQVGLRDFGEREHEEIKARPEKLRAVFDSDWSRARLEGRDLAAHVRGSLSFLPETVWVSFDIDGLDPSLCPGTGTPVPGGLTWAEAMLWLEELKASGRRVIGCDLVEVAPSASLRGGDSWDAIVGARLLYRLAGTLRP